MKPRDVFSNLTAERVRQVVSYDKETGLFTRLESNNQNKPGGIAGTTNKNGYVLICIDGKKVMAHRLAWLCVTGIWPKDRIDHVDLNRSNNRWENLREASDSDNKANSVMKNSIGVKGVEFHVSGKYRARIFIGGKSRHLGLFDTPKQAHAAYCAAAKNAFGEFARFQK
jgi:hypothetical protein